MHGTTLATNVILERRGARTAFVTTEGFGDLFRLGREARVEEDRYDLLFQPVRPPLEHALTFEAPERMTAAGQPLHRAGPGGREGPRRRGRPLRSRSRWPSASCIRGPIRRTRS